MVSADRSLPSNPTSEPHLPPSVPIRKSPRLIRNQGPREIEIPSGAVVCSPSQRGNGAEVIHYYGNAKDSGDETTTLEMKHIYNYFYGMTKIHLRSIGNVWKRRSAGSKLTQVYRMFRFVQVKVSAGSDPVEILQGNEFCPDIFEYINKKNKAEEQYLEPPEDRVIRFELEKNGDPKESSSAGEYTSFSDYSSKLVKGDFGYDEGVSEVEPEPLRSKQRRSKSGDTGTENSVIQGEISSLVHVVQQMANSSQSNVGKHGPSAVHADLAQERDLDKMLELTIKAAERVEAAKKIAEVSNDNRILKAAQLHYERLMQKYMHHRQISGQPQEKS